MDDHVARNRLELANAKREAGRQPVLWPTLKALGALAIGYSQWGSLGGLAGASGGIYFGILIRDDAKAKAKAAMRVAEACLKAAESDRENLRLMPELFSRDEQLTGIRDARLDRESGFANLLLKKNGQL
ncbi:hypothetical protein [Paucibacter soli]|uniref:hypothetical protein n=1 Tax=Paucibacter soli TaxID=3133433 RepID=UPI0030AE530B